jgi:hypothetical protein
MRLIPGQARLGHASGIAHHPEPLLLRSDILCHSSIHTSMSAYRHVQNLVSITEESLRLTYSD